MQGAPSILSTKILDKASHDFARLDGWLLREEDFTRTIPLDVHWPDTLDARSLVIFTSEKGVRHLPSHHPDIRQIACLSGKTLQAVTERFGQEQVICTAKNARELATAISEVRYTGSSDPFPEGRFTNAVFFCALEHRPELPLALRQHHITVTEVPVYETIGQSKVIDTSFEGVLFFSPSGVDSFFQLNKLVPGTVCFAIGETTADAIKIYTDERIITSHIPTQEDLIRCVRFYYDNKQC